MEEIKSLSQYLSELRQYLTQEKKPVNYVDLALLEEISMEKLEQDEAEFSYDNPLAEVFTRINQALNDGDYDRACLGLNELFKAYLRALSRHSPEHNELLQRLNMLVGRALSQNFSYQVPFWDYFCHCVLPAGLYLIEQNQQEDTERFLSCLERCGKLAVGQGLNTTRLQQVLRTMQVAAEERGMVDLAVSARDCRQLMET